MRIVFRSDASRSIGAGHVMRSSAIAEEAISRGIECVFVGVIEDSEWLATRVNSLGFSQVILPGMSHNWRPNDILVLDSYELDPRDKFIQEFPWKKIVSIADEASPDYPADLVFHPGLDGSWYKGDSSEFYSGPEYIPFRKSVKQVSDNPWKSTRKIIVFGGGMDSYDFGYSLAAAITQIPSFEEVVFFSPNKVEIESIDPRFKVKDFGPDLDSEIGSSNLVFTTASTSSLEVMARGIPVGVACAVENQWPNYMNFGKLRIASQVGERISSKSWFFNPEQISKLFRDPTERFELVQNASSLMNLSGSSLIVDLIVE